MSELIQNGEKRREIHVINAWQQIEDPEKNLLGFETNKRARHRTIKDTLISYFPGPQFVAMH